MFFADKILSFNQSLKIDEKLPVRVGVMIPFSNPDVLKVTEQFYHKYYNDNNLRKLIIGINPGRFGAGVTGIPFTDPIRLREVCEIENNFEKKPELSSDFIYRMINYYGGAESFYNEFYISSVSPLGFVKDGKNLNYYDQKELQDKLSYFILDSLKRQINFGIDTNICFCLGEGKNYNYLTKLNQQEHFFKNIIPLAHPRYIMQYKRKKLDDYMQDYLSKIKGIK